MSCAYVCALVMTATTAGQPFTTIINVPPDVAPSTIGTDTQLNLLNNGLISGNFNAGASDGLSTNVQFNMTGGFLSASVQANPGSTVNINGGILGGFFEANSGSTVNISGGSTNSFIDANAGSTVNLSGGNVGMFFDTFTGSTVNLIGGEFQLDGVPVVGLVAAGDSAAVNLPAGRVLTGTHADGTTFVFTSQTGGEITDGTLTLIAAPVPTAVPGVINVPASPAPLGLRAGQTLNLAQGGDLGNNFAAIDTTLNVSGGNIGPGMEVVNTAVSVTGGNVGSNFAAHNGSVVAISGGTVGDKTEASPGSTFNISGGSVGNNFNARASSVVNISGGSVGRFFDAFTGSTINLSGGDFQLDGVTISGLAMPGDSIGFNLPEGSTLSGTHADGSVFVYSTLDGDDIADGTLTLSAISIPAALPGVINVPATPAPLGLRSGQTLNLASGGEIGDNFTTLNATLNIAGGTVGRNLEVYQTAVSVTGGVVGDFFAATTGSVVDISDGSVGNHFLANTGSIVNISGGSFGSLFQAKSGSTVNISGGSLGTIFGANAGSTVNISGGSLGNFFQALSGSTVNISGGSIGDMFFAGLDNTTVNISGGTVGDAFRALNGSTINISGGIVGDNFNSHRDSTVNLSGGTVGNNFFALDGSFVNLIGLSFILDGVDLTPGLLPTDSILVTDRDVILEGILADGSPFSFDLNSAILSFGDFFDPNATLTITLVPEPWTFSLIGAGGLCALRRQRRLR